MTNCPGISSTELMQQVGITFRQVDYWCRIGYLTPHSHINQYDDNGHAVAKITIDSATAGSGSQRCFLPTEVAKAHRLQDFNNAGLSLEPAWELLQNPERILGWIRGFAHLYYQLTGDSVTWEPQPEPVQA